MLFDSLDGSSSLRPAILKSFLKTLGLDRNVGEPNNTSTQGGLEGRPNPLELRDGPLFS